MKKDTVNDPSDKKVSFTYKISLAETDSVGVVYFANYFVLFEKSHMEYLYQAGINNAELINNNVYMPITESHCNIKLPLYYGDIVRVETSIKQLKKAYLEFEYTIFSNNSLKPVATGYTIHLFAGKNFKPIKIPSEIETALKRFLKD